jgi:MFS family permease
MATGPKTPTQFGKIFVVSSGNFLEMYDFMVFGYYASAISKAYFPTGSEFASLMLTLMTFGAGFLMRPVGAIVLGAYIDRHGRRSGLLLVLALMAVGTLAVAFTPTYASIGVAAPVIVLVGRLIQGLSAGVELGGVSVYLAEIAPPGQRGLYCSWQSGSQQVAVMFAAVVGLVTTSVLGSDAMEAWGWRVPFIVGCLLIPFLFVIRSRIEETKAFLSQKRPEFKEVMSTVAANWGIVLRGAMMAIMTTVFFYMITAYTPTYGSKVLSLSASDSLIVTVCVGLANFIMLPLMGALSDRVGRRPLLFTATILALIVGYPIMAWLVSAPSFGRLMAAEVALALIYGCYNGAFIVYMTEMMPARVRTIGFSLAYSLATAIFGGFTPAVSTYLIDVTGNKAMPGAWLASAALIALVAIFAQGSRKQSEFENQSFPGDQKDRRLPQSIQA